MVVIAKMLKKFAAARKTASLATYLAAMLLSAPLQADVSAPDRSDWSEKRLANYARFDHTRQSEGVLRIPDRNIEARIYPDTLRSALEGGLSRVTATRPLGEDGNTAIAGHRDSFFRRLEDVPRDTRVELDYEGRSHPWIVSAVYDTGKVSHEPRIPLQDVPSLLPSGGWFPSESP